MKKLICIVVCVILLQMFWSCKGDGRWNVAEDSTKGLNLTKNSLWDNPALMETEPEIFDSLAENSVDSGILNKMLLFHHDKVSRSEAQKAYYKFKDSMKSEFSSYIGLFYLNDLMVTLPEENICSDTIKYYIEEGYKWARQENPVPLSLFMMYWNNTMLLYSNYDMPDSVYAETQRMMKICKNQDLQVGFMIPYMALGYLLFDERDYTTAAIQFEKADEIAQREFPNLLGKDWQTTIKGRSQLYATYISNLAVLARCRFAHDESGWLDKNSERLLYVCKNGAGEATSNSIYSTLMRYYAKKGDEKKFKEILALSEEHLAEHKIRERSEKGEGSATNSLTVHNLGLIDYYLKRGEATKAMEVINTLPASFRKNNSKMIGDASYMLGHYKEAAEAYKKKDSTSMAILNGRNLHILQTLSARIDAENKEMEMMKAELKYQRMVIFFSVCLAIVALMLFAVILVFYRSKQKQNRKLKIANDAALKANSAKDVFLQNMTHEIHTPMNQIYGFAQMLADPNVPVDEGTTREFANYICEGSKQLNGILDNVVEVTEKLTKLNKMEDVPTVLDFKTITA